MSTVSELFERRRSYGGRALVRHPLCTDPDLAMRYWQARADADQRAAHQADGLGDARLISPDNIILWELEEQLAATMVTVVLRRPTAEREQEYLAELATLPPNASTVEQEKRLILECFEHFELGGVRDDDAGIDELRTVLDSDMLDRRELMGLSALLLSQVSGDLIPKSLTASAPTGGRGAK